MKTLIPHLTALITVAIWGGTFVSTKLLLMAGLTAAQIFVLRFIIAYILLMAMSLMGSGNRQWFCRTWRDELLMAALGITGGSLYFMAENTALNYTTTTNTSLIVCSCPLVAAILIGMVYRSQRMNRQQLTGALMAVAGVAAVILNGHFVLHLSPLGDALALVACLCWAAYSLLMIPANRNYSALFITRKVFFYGLLTILPYFIVHPTMPTMPLLLRPDVAANLLFLSCVASLGCYLAWTWVMDRLGAVVATNYVYLNPLFTIVFAWLILSERITPWFIVGTALIVTGMYLADRKKRE
jgi:drug/metabolite transporter (DMT)-like permease